MVMVCSLGDVLFRYVSNIASNGVIRINVSPTLDLEFCISGHRSNPSMSNTISNRIDKINTIPATALSGAEEPFLHIERN